MSRHSAHKGGKVVSSTHLRTLLLGNIPGTHFRQRLTQPQGHSAAGRIYVNGKFQSHHRELNPRPSGLQRCSSANCATAWPPKSIKPFFKKHVEVNRQINCKQIVHLVCSYYTNNSKSTVNKRTKSPSIYKHFSNYKKATCFGCTKLPLSGFMFQEYIKRKSYSYSYMNSVFFSLWHCDPMRVMASSFLRFLDHTQRRTTVGRTPLDE